MSRYSSQNLLDSALSYEKKKQRMETQNETRYDVSVFKKRCPVHYPLFAGRPTVQYCRNYQLPLFEKTEFLILGEAVKSWSYKKI